MHTSVVANTHPWSSLSVSTSEAVPPATMLTHHIIWKKMHQQTILSIRLINPSFDMWPPLRINVTTSENHHSRPRMYYVKTLINTEIHRLHFLQHQNLLPPEQIRRCITKWEPIQHKCQLIIIKAHLPHFTNDTKNPGVQILSLTKSDVLSADIGPLVKLMS